MQCITDPMARKACISMVIGTAMTVDNKYCIQLQYNIFSS
jgi:hypothetical protein